MVWILVQKKGTRINAVMDGIVDEVGYDKGYGNYTVIKHNDGTKTLYGHQSKIIVNKGDKVKAGQKIGEVGNTVKLVSSLNGDGSHLHLSWDGNKDGKFDKNTKQDNPAHLLYSGE